MASERELLDCVRHLFLDYCLKEVFLFISWSVSQSLKRFNIMASKEPPMMNDVLKSALPELGLSVERLTNSWKEPVDNSDKGLLWPARAT